MSGRWAELCRQQDRLSFPEMAQAGKDNHDGAAGNNIFMVRFTVVA